MKNQKLTLTVLFMIFGTANAETLELPFKGRWFVAQGGDTVNVNHHMGIQAQWYGVDFAKTGGLSGRQLAKGDAREVGDFYCWNQPVLSPAIGRVRFVQNSLPDNVLGETDKNNPAGNYVVIELSEGKYLFLAHMKEGSIEVAADEAVVPGQKIGLCGNSGNSDYPHVHLHIQDVVELNSGTGQNPVFGPVNVELTGKNFKNVEWPLVRGLFVSNK